MSRRIANCLVAALLIAALGCQSAPDKELQAGDLFKEYCAAWTAHDPDKVISYLSEDCVYEHIPRGKAYQGKEVIRAFAKATFEAVPDFTVEVTSVFASGDWLASEWVMSGTVSLAHPDFPDIGTKFTVRGSSIVQLREGMIFRNADYWDRSTFLRQTGQMN